ncbi:hypothetical protein BJA01nite_73350 [Bradyrhizobium japonicum]|nr:hypothetical protein BJA01nite_73350 [Bradyrhizobium japonicum]
MYGLPRTDSIEDCSSRPPDKISSAEQRQAKAVGQAVRVYPAAYPTPSTDETAAENPQSAHKR